MRQLIFINIIYIYIPCVYIYISKTNTKFCFILLNAKLLSNILYELFIDTREIIIDAAFALTLIFNR